MAFVKQEVKAGDIMDPNWGNHIQTQYENALNDFGIVETGSNANGKYIKWANGYQECMRTVNLDLNTNGVQEFAFPANFIDDKVNTSFSSASITTVNRVAYVMKDVVTSSVNNSWQVRCIGELSAIIIPVHLKATGWWK